MSSKVLFMTALIFAFLALGTYVMLLGPAAAQTALGTITGKKFKPAGTYWQYPVGADRSLRTVTEIPIAEAYVFEIAADGLQGPLFFSLNVVASREFEVGQKVRIVYRQRGLPFIWSRIFVEKMVAESR
jgi:hypothetical protein